MSPRAIVGDMTAISTSVAPNGLPIHRLQLDGTRAVTALVAFDAGAREEEDHFSHGHAGGGAHGPRVDERLVAIVRRAIVDVAGLVICRQRPGTAKGFVFLTLEDETGPVNVVITPKRFEQQALLISTSPLLLIRGTLQVEQNVVNVRAEKFRKLDLDGGEKHAKGRNFH